MVYLGIHGYLNPFKSFMYTHFTMICPNNINMWDMKSLFVYGGTVLIIMKFFMVVFINTIFFLLWVCPTTSSSSKMWNKSHPGVTPIGI